MRLGGAKRLPLTKFFSSASAGRLLNVIAEDGPFWLTSIGFAGSTSTGEIKVVADGTERAVVVPAAISDLGYENVKLNVPFSKTLDIISSASVTNFTLFLEISRAPNELPHGSEETKYLFAKQYSFSTSMDSDTATGGKVLKRIALKPGSDVSSVKLIIDDREYELAPAEFDVYGFINYRNRVYVHAEASAATTLSLLMEVV